METYIYIAIALICVYFLCSMSFSAGLKQGYKQGATEMLEYVSKEIQTIKKNEAPDQD